MALEITVNESQPHVVVLALEGSIDSQGHGVLRQTIESLQEKPLRAVVLDMDGVVFVTSEGIGVIFQTQKELRERGAELAMLNLRPQVKRVFETIHLLSFNTVFNSVAELDRFLLQMQHEIIEEEEHH
jgi:stage II sporulation protein AA (anti-sigma F factor antagonist)